VVIESRRAVVFCSGDDWEQYGEVVEEGVRKKNYGGFSGYAEHNVRRHVEEHWHKHLKETAELVFSLFQERQFDFLFVGGHKDQLDELVEALHPYVSGRFAGDFIIDPHTMTPAEVRDQVREMEAKARRERELGEVRKIYDTAASGGLAVVGLPGSLDAANAKAAERVVVVGTYLKPGAVCPSCGFLSLTEATCPACGTGMAASADIVNELVESVIDSAGSFLQVLDDTSEAIGAFLRFHVPK
jgi:peptide subunit release factor 1 (eRF1)